MGTAEMIPAWLLAEETAYLGAIIADLMVQVQLEKQQNNVLRQCNDQLAEANLHLTQVVTSSDQEKAGLLEKLEEAIKKGWQLDEFKRMLFGKKSERYTAYSSDITAVIQPSLGRDFDAGDIDAVIAASRARASAREELEAQQAGQKTNRHTKRHHVNSGPRNRKINRVEVVTNVIDYKGDKTGMKPCGKKLVTVFDYRPGAIVKTETHYLKYINEQGQIFKEAVAPRIIERGTVSNRLVAQMHIEKFVYYMPYYRQRRRICPEQFAFAVNNYFR
jgi:transposase